MAVFEKGNKYGSRNPKVVYRKFLEMLVNAANDKTIRSYEDACASIGWRDSKCNYWSKKLPVFATLKSDIQATIRRRINNGALDGDFHAAAAIWRMKQLGERDTQYQNLDHTTKGDRVTLTPMQFVRTNDNDSD